LTLKPAHLQWSDDGILRSLDFDDIYFQRQQGLPEKHYVFLEKNRLPERFTALEESSFRIAELGFGSGLNFLLTARLWSEAAPKTARLTYVSIEKHPILAADLRRIFSFWPELQGYAAPLLEQYPPLLEGFHHLCFLGGRIRLMLLFGDVADTLPELTGSFDAWYLDGFSPAKNPAMWEENIFPRIAARTRPGGTLSTFSSAAAVRSGLASVGFNVEKTEGYGVKRVMTVAKMPGGGMSRGAQKKNVVVLGAGIAGASAAYALAQKGCAVTLVDRRTGPAQETSGNPDGVLYSKLTVDPSPFGLFHQHGFCFTRNLSVALKLQSWDPCGVVHLDLTEEGALRHRALADTGRWPGEFLSYGDTGAGNGLSLPLAGHLSPPELCRALIDHPNIRTLFSTEASSLEWPDHDAVVVALNWGAKSFPETSWLPLSSLRGQYSFLKATPQSEKITRLICHEGHISPAVNGIHYAGATFQREEPAAPELRDSDHRENLFHLDKNIPGLGFSEASVIGGCAGYRIYTPDRLPLIGACPDSDALISAWRATPSRKREDALPGIIGESLRGRNRNIYVSTAFGSHGLPGAPLAGEIVAAQICGGPLPVPASLMKFLAPERFILRDLKRGKI
jgi:tRNA 5-methylaminomethyl-2-thiouridine biosynthesis bifunctional protein